MAVTPIQSAILRLLANRRRESGESYVAGGVALNALLGAPRRSHDIDLFHDTTEALGATWSDDRQALDAAAAARRLHYSQIEVNALDFGDNVPDARILGQQWHEALQAANLICGHLPSEKLGTCIVAEGVDLFRGGPVDLEAALRDRRISFHEGRIGGSWPTVTS